MNCLRKRGKERNFIGSKYRTAMRLISSLMMLLAALTGCREANNLNPDAFEALLGQGEVFLLDVRTPDEYAEGHLPGAANADWQAADFLDQAEKLCPKDRPVGVYCRSGKRSAAAAKTLVKAGYTVHNLLGGILGWKKAGKTVVTDEP